MWFVIYFLYELFYLFFGTNELFYLAIYLPTRTEIPFQFLFYFAFVYVFISCIR
jgi:hypothetical protein